jgi:predicted DNA-binding transcriptional regulator
MYLGKSLINLKDILQVEKILKEIENEVSEELDEIKFELKDEL